MGNEFNVLVSCAGRRVQLVDGFRAAIKSAGLEGRVFAADASSTSPASFAADKSFAVPRLDDSRYLESLLEICANNSVRVLVPTIDTELELYSEARAAFADVGTTVAVSSPQTINITHDKRATHQWLTAEGFPTVAQCELAEARAGTQPFSFPVIVKPTRGSMSTGVVKVERHDCLPATTNQDVVVQAFADGEEYTISTFVDSSGRCRDAVPRLRIVVRGGEVSTARTEHDVELESLAIAVCERLPGAYGALNVQVIRSPDSGALSVIEINARFGGGDPLAWAAGANSPRWLVEDVAGIGGRSATNTEWVSGMTMARFDRALYLAPDGSAYLG